MRKPFRALGLVAVLGAMTMGCGTIQDIHDAVYGEYHRLSPADFGVYITIKRYATDCMILGFNLCKLGGKSDDQCGREMLKQARDKIVPKLHGTARDLWNGDYSVFGWHPNIGNAFKDDEAGDFAQAVRDLASRGDECLRVHWKPSGENWTTVDDEGVAECSWGPRLTDDKGRPFICTR